MQSVLQRNLCHASHPIGGVRANPLSRECDVAIIMKKTTKVSIPRVAIYGDCSEILKVNLRYHFS